MSQKFIARMYRVEDTHIGRILATDPVARARHEKIVNGLRRLVRDEVIACERGSRRLTRDREYFPVV